MHKLLVASLALLLASCVSHSRATEMSGVNGMRGVPVEYQRTTSWSLDLLFVFSLIGDASVNTTVEEFAAEAAAHGSPRMRVTQTASSTYWYIFPPISFFVHPTRTTVEGDVEVDALPAN